MSDRCTVYLGCLSDGRYVYVSSAPDNRYETFRLFIGPASKMLPVQIVEVERFRDGGTTLISTEGYQTLSVPSPLNRSATDGPCWHSLNPGGDPYESSDYEAFDVELLDPLHFEITETPEGAAVRAVSKA